MLIKLSLNNWMIPKKSEHFLALMHNMSQITSLRQSATIPNSMLKANSDDERSPIESLVQVYETIIMILRWHEIILLHILDHDLILLSLSHNKNFNAHSTPTHKDEP